MRRKLVVSCVLFLGGAAAAHAQLGSGWTEQTFGRRIHLDNEAGLQTFDWSTYQSVCSPICADYRYDGGTDTHTFRLIDNRTNRSEIRVQNEYSTGRKQFEGYVTIFSPLDDESLMQVFGSTSGATQMMIRGYAESGGTLRTVGGGGTLETGIYGQERRINVIHVQGSYIRVYVNGSQRAQISDGENVNNYWKYGCYGTLRTNGAQVKWRRVRFYTDGQPPGTNQPTPTPAPTSTPLPVPTATPTPTPTSCVGCGSELSVSAVSASTDDGNVPANTIDYNLATRWSANGDGQWVRFDLGTTRLVTQVRVAVYNGNGRSNRFDLQYSNDGTAWGTLALGLQSSGTTTQEETYEVPDTPARFVRYLGHGADVSTFNSVTEVSILGSNVPNPTPSPTPAPTSTPTAGPTATPTPPTGAVEITPGAGAVTASTNDGNLPGNTVDGNLATRWSANGDGQWIQYDLGSTRTVSSVKLAWHSGDVRNAIFDVQISGASSGPWTTLLAGRQSNGTTLALEEHDVPDASGRYVRIVGHGNSVNLWNSVTETEIWGN
jgi:hypothetical protein